MTPNYLEFHTIKSDEPKLLPPVKIQRNKKITKKKGKSGRCAWAGGEGSRGRTCLEHPLQGTGDHIRDWEVLQDWKVIKQHALSILLILGILRKVC